MYIANPLKTRHYMQVPTLKPAGCNITPAEERQAEITFRRAGHFVITH